MENGLSYSQNLRITAEAKILVAAQLRQEIQIKWDIVHEFEREARHLIQLAKMEDELVN